MNISLAAEPIAHLGSFPLTNTLVMAVAVSVFLLAIALVARSRLTLAPMGIANGVEAVVEWMLNGIDSVTHDRTRSERFLPLVGTIFLFVIVSNWIELVPGLGTVGIREVHEGKSILVPFIRSASADLNVTLAVAIASVAATQWYGIRALGLRTHLGKFLTVKNPIASFVGILELISEFAKVVSFAFRLFGNIFAGEVLLLVVATLVPYLVPIPFLALELFVGFVQALVFAMLTLVNLTMATQHVEH